MFWKKIIERRKLYLKQKQEEESYLKEDFERHRKYEEQKKDLELLNEKIIKETERLKITEERLLQTQEEIELKIKLTEQGGTPQELFTHSLKLAMQICWDLNKDITKDIIEKVKNEESEKERIKYDKAAQGFLTKFDYIEGIMLPESIAKVLYKLKEDKMIAERIENKIALQSISNQLNVLKELGITK